MERLLCTIGELNAVLASSRPRKLLVIVAKVDMTILKQKQYLKCSLKRSVKDFE